MTTSKKHLRPEVLGKIARLEFDFKAAKDSIAFRYSFASEEYGESIGTEYADAMAIFPDSAHKSALIETVDFCISRAHSRAKHLGKRL